MNLKEFVRLEAGIGSQRAAFYIPYLCLFCLCICGLLCSCCCWHCTYLAHYCKNLNQFINLFFVNICWFFYYSSVSFLPVQVGSSCHLQHLCQGQHPLLCPFQPPILCIPLHIHFLHQCLHLLFHPLLQQPVLWACHQLPTLTHFQQSPSSSQVSNIHMYIIIRVCIMLAVMAHMHPDLCDLCLALKNCVSFSCLVSLFSIALDVQIPPLAGVSFRW